MTAIQFVIGEEHAVELQPERGDPNELFREGQARVVEAVEERGYAFEEGSAPDYQEFVAAFDPGEGEVVLGDLSNRVYPVDVRDSGTGDSEDTVTLVLVGPGGESLEQAFRETQNLGAVTVSVTEQHNFGLGEQVVLFPTEDREEILPTETLVEDLATETLYWDVTMVEEE